MIERIKDTLEREIGKREGEIDCIEADILDGRISGNDAIEEAKKKIKSLREDIEAYKVIINTK